PPGRRAEVNAGAAVRKVAAVSGAGSRALPSVARRLLAWIPAVLISIVCVEVLLQAAVRLGFVNLDLPSYSLALSQPFWQDINADFGVWHPPNSTSRHQRSCFDLIYTSNSHGIRDRED